MWPNITIFEREEQVGGNAHTFTYNGIKAESAVGCFQKDPLVVSLLKDVGVFSDFNQDLPYSFYCDRSGKWLNLIDWISECKNKTLTEGNLLKEVRYHSNLLLSSR